MRYTKEDMRDSYNVGYKQAKKEIISSAVNWLLVVAVALFIVWLVLIA